ILVAEEAGELDAPPLSGRRVAVLHIGDGLEERPSERLRSGGAHCAIAVRRDGVVRRQRPGERGAALAEDLEKHAEAASRAVDLALDHSGRDQLRLSATGGPNAIEV